MVYITSLNQKSYIKTCYLLSLTSTGANFGFSLSIISIWLIMIIKKTLNFWWNSHLWGCTLTKDFQEDYCKYVHSNDLSSNLNYLIKNKYVLTPEIYQPQRLLSPQTHVRQFNIIIGFSSSRVLFTFYLVFICVKLPPPSFCLSCSSSGCCCCSWW